MNHTNELKTRIDVKSLLETLKANRDNHAKLYAEAAVGYQKKAIAALQEKIKELQHEPVSLYFLQLNPPTDYTDHYNRAIRMLERTLDTDVTLDQQQFAQYVDDEWEWAKAWVTSNSSYSSSVDSYGISKGWTNRR